jgi:hypothetical protein
MRRTCPAPLYRSPPVVVSGPVLGLGGSVTTVSGSFSQCLHGHPCRFQLLAEHEFRRMLRDKGRSGVVRPRPQGTDEPRKGVCLYWHRISCSTIRLEAPTGKTKTRNWSKADSLRAASVLSLKFV